MNDRETRCYSGEVRAEQRTDEPTRILGYGSVFNSRSEPLWGFREIIKPGAFDDVLNDDVRGLFNHDPNFILGRSAAGTLSLSVDDRGLRYDITAPDTQTIRDLVLAPMLRGDITQSSFAFRVARDGEHVCRKCYASGRNFSRRTLIFSGSTSQVIFLKTYTVRNWH